MISINDWQIYFPFAEPRAQQVFAIDFILNAFINDKKKFCVAEMGTGIGKSAIGLTVSRYLAQHRLPEVSQEIFKDGSHILTTQKVLQEQYLRDFGPPNGGLVSIKSSTNYQCEYHKENTCGESLRIVKNEPKGGPFWQKCMLDCNYRRAKQKFIDAHAGTTNYSYFLAETMYGGKIPPKQLLVCDESHNLEEQLSKFVEVMISARVGKDLLGLAWPTVRTTQEAIDWLSSTYEPKLKAFIARQESMVAKLNFKEKIKEFKALASQVEMLDKHICKLHRFLNMWSDDNWIINVHPGYGRESAKIEFKPVDVGPYSDELLFKHAHNVLLMSATIVDSKIFCKTVGVDENDTAVLNIDSPFPIENRPVLFAPVGHMSQASLDETLPKLAEMVGLILEQHKNEKGVIHAHTYKIANYIKSTLKNKRLLIHDASDRDEIVKKHIESKKPTVLLSPSLAEGIDLRDDLSRFQVICKIPYPYLGDKLVKKRMDKNKGWYAYQTAKTIIQASGRSIRSDSDHAVTYILDGNWEQFYRQNSHLFPNSFRNALKS